jgi:4'-phosphopantetheinyl transferase
MRADRLPPPALAAGEVHVWSWALGRPAGEVARLLELLADDERERAGRYLHVPAREQFIAARAGLRLILAGYLALDPARIAFTHGPAGKPALAGGGLHFNVSHTQGLVLIAVTREGEVGIDVERLRTMPTHLDLAGRFFTPGEVAGLRRLPAGASEAAFYAVWTRKEAFLKATGLGLPHGLERFEVSVPPDDPARILHIDGDAAAGARWSLTALEPAPGYVGALAIEGRGHRVLTRRFEGAG